MDYEDPATAKNTGGNDEDGTDLERARTDENPVGADAGSPSPQQIAPPVPVSALSADEAVEHEGEDDEDRSDLESQTAHEDPAGVDAGSPSPQVPVSAPSADEA